MKFSILIELPLFIKKELSRLSIGLPNAEWESEENLYIKLYVFNKINDLDRWNMMEKLGEVIANPFSLKIHRLDYLQRRNNGILIAGLESSLELNTLKKKIEGQIRSSHNTPLENDKPIIQLGFVRKESVERIGQYFESYGEFQSSSFEIHEFVFAQLHETDKRHYYTVEKRFFLM